MTAELEAALAALGSPPGEPVALDGGITNRNFRVGDLVVRLPGADTGLLGIDREAERAATEAAARTGLGPQVVACLTAPPCLVTRFIEGRPVTAEELRAPALIRELAGALRAYHEGPPLPARFDAFAVIEDYRATAAARGGRSPAHWERMAVGAAAIRAALQGPEHAPVPCHNDLLTANLLHDGARLRLVDWEYAGMGDRYFDLGNLSVNNGFATADDERLLAAYYGEPCPPRRLAAVALMRIVSDLREAMWGVVQATVSELDFDFTAYADDHAVRVLAGLEDPRFETWLEEARGDRP